MRKDTYDGMMQALFGLTVISTMLENNGNDKDDLLARALCNYLYREVIEDLHVAGISQEKMNELNHKAVNRARFFVDEILHDERNLTGFYLQALGCEDWDTSEADKDSYDILPAIKAAGTLIKEFEKGGTDIADYNKKLEELGKQLGS